MFALNKWFKTEQQQFSHVSRLYMKGYFQDVFEITTPNRGKQTSNDRPGIRENMTLMGKTL